MNHEDIIRMAREAGTEHIVDLNNDFVISELKRFATVVAAHEREACAKLCDEFESDADPDAGVVLAAAIRARGQE